MAMRFPPGRGTAGARPGRVNGPVRRAPGRVRPARATGHARVRARRGRARAAPWEGPAGPAGVRRRTTAVTAVGACAAPVAATPAEAGVGGVIAAIAAAGVFGVLAVLLRRAGRTIDRRREALLRELIAYAVECGWRTVPVPSSLPAPVARAARSRNSRLVLATDAGGLDTWLVWHHWVQSSGQISADRDLTRCFVRLGAAVPDAVLRRRTGVGAFFRPVRGVGTGDAVFDRRFLARGSDREAVRRLLTPELRRDMLSGRRPMWAVDRGMLVVFHESPPRANNLRPWAASAASLARLLTSR